MLGGTERARSERKVYRTYAYMSYEFDNVLATAQISDLALRQGEIMGSLKGRNTFAD